MDPAVRQVAVFDGGGTRGMITATILEAFEEVQNNGSSTREEHLGVADYFPTMVATSTGTLIAAGLTAPGEMRKTAKEVANLYLEKAPIAFHQSYIQEMETGDGYYRTKYRPEGLEQVIEEFAGDILFKDLVSEVRFPVLSPELLVTSTTSDAETCIWFSRDEAIKSAELSTLKVSEVLRATTAAPTYFPPKTLKIGDVQRLLLDGGICINNPTAEAAVHMAFDRGLGRDLSLFSIGTGRYPLHVAESTLNRGGALDWAVPIINHSFVWQDKLSTDHGLRIISDHSKFFRIQPILGEDIALDDTTKMSEMRSIARDAIAERDEEFRKFCKKLVRRKV